MRLMTVLSAVLFFLFAAGVKADDAQLRTGHSGITIKILGFGKMNYASNAKPSLMLKYETHSDIKDLKALRIEARKIWVDFEDDADGSGLDSAIISASTPAQGDVLQKSQMYNFVFQKGPGGDWTCTDDEINQWLVLTQGKDPQKLMAGLQKWAESGDTIAMIALGNRYQYGSDGTPKNSGEALKWYQMAVKQGDPVAGNNIGMACLSGEGVKQDYQKAYQWFAWAAKQGNALGEENLGLLYMNGWGVPKDESKAFAYYSQAAAKGTADAIGVVGTLYLGGVGVKKDVDHAFALIEEAAEWGSADAQANLSYLYAEGLGTKKDCDQAFKWAKLSADNGSSAGEDNLGSCYEEGCGVAKNIQEALKYYKLSADQGSDAGKNDLTRLAADKPQ